MPKARISIGVGAKQSFVRATSFLNPGRWAIALAVPSGAQVDWRLRPGRGHRDSEIQCFLDQAVEIDTPTFAAAARRMLQHALNGVRKIGAKPLIFYQGLGRAEP